MSLRPDTARALLVGAIRDRVTPAAVVDVGTSREPLWQEAFGTLQYDPSAAATLSTVFDLASLTKPLVTTTLIMRLVDAGALALDDEVATWIPEWRAKDRAFVTVGDLLEHAAGLTAWLPLYQDAVTPADVRHAIAISPLEYVPRTRAVYSDLGFILLGCITELASGAALAAQAAALFDELGLSELVFHPPSAWRARTAPTEFDPWRGRLLVGEVHDENCWALGGAAGHAGLFGTAAEVGRFARLVLHVLRGDPDVATQLRVSVATAARFIERSRVPGSSRALGWDTMLPTSSCGTRMSPQAFGHTGFTGTSLWIDPARDLYVVLLTNRVHPSRDHNALKPLRPVFHDAIIDGLVGGRPAVR